MMELTFNKYKIQKLNNLITIKKRALKMINYPKRIIIIKMLIECWIMVFYKINY